MTSLHSVQLSKAVQLVSEEEQSYESTILTSPLPCESSVKMEELLEETEIWLEDLNGESPARSNDSHSQSSDSLVLPPRRRLSFASRRNYSDDNDQRKYEYKQIMCAVGGSSTARRAQSMDHTRLSQSTGAIECDPASIIPHSTCLLRTRALSVGAIDIASWKLADRCRRRSKGNSSLQEVSKSVRALPREEELQELEELDKSLSILGNSSHSRTLGRNVSKSRSRSPGTKQGARTTRRGSIYGSLEERLSKSTGAIEFSYSTSSLPQRTCLVRARRTLSFGGGDSRSSSKQAAAGGSERRRMLKQGKQLLSLKGVSNSVRALPRENEMEMENPEDDHLEDSFQAIFDKISDIDAKVRSIMKEFAI